MSQLIIRLMLLCALSSNSFAEPSIALLDFELSDLTSLPNTPAEKQRTASVRPLLEQALRQQGNYPILPIPADTQSYANPGFGYLFNHEDLAAELGAKLGADWIIVGRHSKPSYLYSHLMVKLVQVNQPSLVIDLDVELKGNHEKVMQRSVNSLANKIHLALAKYHR